MLASEESEFYFYTNRYCDRLAVFLGRLKFPGAYSFQCFLVESHAESTFHFQASRTSGGIDNQPQNHSSLVLGLTRLFRLLRIGLVECAGSGHPNNPGTEDSATASSARARAHTTADARTNAAPTS